MADEPTKPESVPEGKTPETPAPPDLVKVAESLVVKHGDTTKALMVLLDENYRHRETARELKAKLPAEGSLVLTGEDAKVYQRYRALGDPHTLATALTERDHLREVNDGVARDKLHSEVAIVAGYKAAVLSRLATTDNVDLVIEDLKDKAGRPVMDKLGKPARGAFVKNEDGSFTDLSEYAAKHWDEFLPALKADTGRPVPVNGTPQSRFETPPRPVVSPVPVNVHRDPNRPRRANVL